MLISEAIDGLQAKKPERKARPRTGKHPQKAPKKPTVLHLMQTEEAGHYGVNGPQNQKKCWTPTWSCLTVIQESGLKIETAIKEEAKRIVNKMSQDHNMKTSMLRRHFETVEVMHCRTIVSG